MKRLFCVLALLAVIVVAASAKGNGQVSFSKTSHDFGTIKSDAGAVTAVYEFTNISKSPLSIITVTNGGCGCTTPDFTREPIGPGAKGEVRITFEPRGRRGEFNRQVKVRTVAGGRKATMALTFKGVIVPGK